jgi:hypothetical protein
MKIEAKIIEDNGRIHEFSGNVPDMRSAYNECLSRRRRHERRVADWKCKIFAAGAMWARMELTGISDVVGAAPFGPEADKQIREDLDNLTIRKP